jgi:DNA-binding transcriptional MerR regulator
VNVDRLASRGYSWVLTDRQCQPTAWRKSAGRCRVELCVRIGQAAQVSGASVRSLRYYENEGLITPGRHPNGYRDYCPSTISTIVQVRSLLQVGLPVRLIREVLPDLAEEGDPTGPVCEEFLEKVQSYRDRLAAHIADLALQRSALDAFLRQARRTSR